MALQIKTSENANSDLSNFVYNKESALLRLDSKDIGVLNYQSVFPFNKIPDAVFDPSNNIDKVLIFRNNYFKEKTVIKLKFNDGTKNIDCGFIFSLRGIIETDHIITENKTLGPYAVRALIGLLHNTTSLPAKLPDLKASGEFYLEDFYDDDLIICVISKQQLPGFNEDTQLSLLFHLNLFGFYLLNSEKNKHFQPEDNEHQKAAFKGIIDSQNKGTITFNQLSVTITTEPYFEYYVTSLVNNKLDYLAKFFSIYQCYEILINYVTKKEIQDLLSDPTTLSSKSGHTIKGMVNEIGDEGYRVKRLFNKHSTFIYRSDRPIGYEMFDFLTNYRPDFELRSNASCGDFFYDLRNTLVHNLRICYTGSPNEVLKKTAKLSTLVTSIEFLTTEAIIGLRL